MTKPMAAPALKEWTIARLQDARESGAVEPSVPDHVIEREAAKLETLIYQLACSFVDNEFDESYQPTPTRASERRLT